MVITVHALTLIQCVVAKQTMLIASESFLSIFRQLCRRKCAVPETELQHITFVPVEFARLYVSQSIVVEAQTQFAVATINAIHLLHTNEAIAIIEAYGHGITALFQGIGYLTETIEGYGLGRT